MQRSWDKKLEPYRSEWVKGDWPTIPESFHLSVSRYPDEVFFQSFSPQEISLTFKEVEVLVVNTARYLVYKGMKKGDKVGLTGKNSPWWAAAYLAIQEAGGIVVPLDYQMDTEVVDRILDFTEVDIFFIDQERYDSLGNKREGLHKISLSKEKPNFIGKIEQQPVVKYERPEENDIAGILFTSGTTGREKGVMLTHANFICDAYQACDPDYLTAEQRDVWYALLPLHHSYCMTAVFMEAIINGSKLVFAGGLSVSHLMKDLKQGQVTMVMGIPLLYNKILKGLMKQVRGKGLAVHLYIGLMMRISGFMKKVLRINPGKRIFVTLLKKANLYQVKYLICGGGPLAPETFRRYNELGLDFVQGYGMTETAPITALNPWFKFKEKSVGKVLPLCEMKIIDPDEAGIGEIAVKGPVCCKGYYNNEEATAELFDSDGWLLTGDVGYLDKENYLYLTGRKKSLIVTEGGKNVFPEEIEDEFQLFQQIEQIMIKGYLKDEATRAEGIEAVIFPSEEHYRTLGVFNKEKIKQDMILCVKEVNRNLLVYKKITKIRIEEEAMEMTTTKKLKRPVILEKLASREDSGFLI